MKVKCHHCGHEWNYGGKNPYYAMCPTCRYKVSLKRQEIAELNIGGLGDGQGKEPEPDPETDPEAVKANREAYCQKFIEEQNWPICWTCGVSWGDNYLCKSCHCEYYAAIPDAKYCPACGRADVIPAWEGDSWNIEYKNVDQRLDELNREKFPKEKKRMFSRSVPLTKMNLKELQEHKAEIEAAIMGRKNK